MKINKLILITLLLVFTLIFSSKFALANKEANNETYKMLNLFAEVLDKIHTDYVEETTDKKLLENAINGMLSSLDPHSSYLNESDFKDIKTQTSGQFGGLGIEVTMENGLVKVITPIDDTPAFRAGIKSGDYIVSIDGNQVMGMTLNEAVEKMRGPVNTQIKISIRREGAAPFDVTLTRDMIKIKSVRSKIMNDVIYLRISSFNENTSKSLAKEISSTKKEVGEKLKGYVLDLRNNPGGLLDQAIDVADFFLNEGEVVSTRSRDPKDTQRYNAKKGDLTDGLPLVALVNDGSASASEIVAGALKDHKRAIIMGEKSFGKGSVQTIIPLGDGAIKLTTARYYTPSGTSIQGTGIEPDIIVKPSKVEELDNKYMHLSEADLKNALKNDQKTEEPVKKDNEPDNKETDEDELIKKDYQFQRAADLVRGLSLYNKAKE